MSTVTLKDHVDEFQIIHEIVWVVATSTQDLASFVELRHGASARIERRLAGLDTEFLVSAYADITHCLRLIETRWRGLDDAVRAREFATRQLVIERSVLATQELDWVSRRRRLLMVQILQLFEQTDTAKKIPRTIHLLKTDDDAQRINPINYWSIKSILDNNPSYEVILHSALQPSGELWELLLPRLTVNIEDPPQFLGNHRLQLAAHQADVWRVQKLIQYGGFYFDWDVVLLRSLDELRANSCVMGLERTPTDCKEALGVSAIGAQANSVFLNCWLNMMPGAFNPKQYLAHSVSLAREIACALPTAVNVLDATSFYYPGWTTTDMDWLFEPAQKVPSAELAKVFHRSWGVHFFESNASFLKHADKVPLVLASDASNNFEALLKLAGL